MAKYDPKNARPAAIIERLWLTGHFDNPDMPTGIKKADLAKLTLYSDETRTAIRSCTEFLAAVAEQESFRINGRSYHFDGEFGPATEATILADRCEHPDYHVRELDLYDGYETLSAYEEATTAAALGQAGNWKGCNGIGNFHSCHVKFLNAPPAHLTRNDNLRFCLEAVTAANQAIGLQMYWSGPGCPIQDGTGHAQLTAQYVPSSNGWLGLAQVVTNRPCNSQHWSRYLGTYLRTGTDAQIRRMWPILFLHEFGHNMGTGHTRGGIMNPGLLSLNATWSGDVLSSWLRTHYGGEPIPVAPKPDPKPDPDPDPKPHPKPEPDGLWFSGSFTAKMGDRDLGEYILVPKPRL
jgi:hypothetical protein